ncbi:uncharacterized protein JN550_013363 [Neoarthrinium moseri]|uniref:uncharacterized protein n=1 Tax=Neoarthrinium moseri TaxID=1658444 RepID=UPI001FDE45E5|nr:uncharacterized protein JN550_013363 [Neoarthrinium moseri]KAI1857280.1 hypothetical protein JN550_013363 [Neoarthrinium moseri]
MGWVDQVPRAGNLYIGGLRALFQPEVMHESGITHVLSIVDYDAGARDQLQGLRHLHIDLEDLPSENILQHFDGANQFIADGLRGEGGVFVHCAMGKSRSATLICAYLMWRDGVTPEQALDQLCEGRPVCQPNEGFMEQLRLYHRVLRAKDEDEKRDIVTQWEGNRFRGKAWEWVSDTSRNGSHKL